MESSRPPVPYKSKVWKYINNFVCLKEENNWKFGNLLSRGDVIITLDVVYVCAWFMEALAELLAQTRPEVKNLSSPPG